LTDVRTPLDAVAVLVDEVSEAHAARAQRELQASRALRHASPTLSDLREMVTGEMSTVALPRVELIGVELMGVELLSSDAPGADEHDPRPEHSHVRGILGWSDALASPTPVWGEVSTDAPHMLVAGATGSGKTETLVALLASMSAAHSPERFRFAVIDFKGGGGFARVASLAHNAVITTDLDGDDVLRALAWQEADFLRFTEGSPVRRIGHAQWLRNAAVVAGNALCEMDDDKSNADFVRAVKDALQHLLVHESHLVREHAQWALNQ
jgi:hypothetical protein